MGDNLWQPARFKDAEVWIHLDAEGRPIKDARGLVEFRYQLSGKSYHSHGDRLQPVDGAPPVAGPANAPTAAGAQPASAPARQSATTRTPQRTASVGALAAGTIEVWTDGACSGNPGPAGLGVHVREGGRVRELSEFIGQGTNNIAELLAIHRGLEMIEDRASAVAVMSDSEYSLGLLTKGWKPKKNQEIVAELRALVATFSRLTFVKVAGHAGIEGNERADLLARRAIEARATTRTAAALG